MKKVVDFRRNPIHGVAHGSALGSLAAMDSLLTVCFWIALYLLPSIVAACRHHNNEGSILALNFLLGWSVLGWVIAFVWACSDNTRPARARRAH